ncbi:MAG: DUF6282 family protein [Ancrocorticia sp.]|uniref:DUF6282 family protein n=1 Tax=Ancrocorticia sp. TaxID=2593684 RepID=UPI003F929139
MVEIHPVTDRARKVVQGGYDCHVHTAPDVIKRRIDDISLARRFAELGMGGFIIKSHFTPTAERAALARQAVPETNVRGAITLNGAVGGLNAVAVEILARDGGQYVWFPTVDSRNERQSVATAPSGAKPAWWNIQQELRDSGIASPEVELYNEAGQPLKQLLDVLDVIAKYDLTLATGHISGEESAKLIPIAKERGVKRIVLTHPEFTSQRIPVDVQKSLAAEGVLLERCVTTALTGKVSWETWLGNMRECGVENSIGSSDMGQPSNPPVEDGLGIIADVMLDNGFTEEEAHHVTVTNTRIAAGIDPLP